MKKKLAIIGNGTAGAVAAAYFHRWTDYDIDWYYDPNIPTQAVGEGSTLGLPNLLHDCLNFKHIDLSKIDGSFKSGILKTGWADGGTYFHTFPGSAISYHFNAKGLQKYVFDSIGSSDRVSIKQDNVTAETVDADFVMDCSGTPTNFDNFHISNYIPVNSVHVTQCYWDHPEFQYTLALARPYGWVFGIPLQNRCSIGYLYNKDFNSLDEVKEDVKDIFLEYNLTPSNTTNSFNFKNYYRKQNFNGRIARNGNASFFLEPLEATSIYFMIEICVSARKLWEQFSSDHDEEYANFEYLTIIREVEHMIMFHYYAGSIYDNDFWKYARNKGADKMNDYKRNTRFQELLQYIPKYSPGLGTTGEYGTWSIFSWKYHLDNFLPNWQTVLL